MRADDMDAVLDLARSNLTPDELPADMEAVRMRLGLLARDLERDNPWQGTRSAEDASDIRALLKAYQEQRRALEAAAPVVPVGVREAVLKAAQSIHNAAIIYEDEALLEDAEIVIAALRPTDTGWRDIATAPRDGTDVLACDDETGERHVSYWTGDCWSGRNRFKPTHWMLLSPAPTDTGRE
jgi:hypothetical protein